MKYLNKLSLIPLIGLLFTILPSCSQTEDIRSAPISEDLNNQETINYLALGDSYTVGESVAFEDSFPKQLNSTIEENKNYNVNTTVIAQTGWRTDQLLSSIGGRETGEYNLITLLIGVNNQFQSRPFSQYESEFTELLNKAISLAGNDSNKVIVLSIPDYYYTPYGQSNGSERISIELDRYNDFAKSTAQDKGVTFLNITDITRKGIDEPELVASDGLHPSGLAYEKFVERLYPLVSTRLKD
ncbi:SGNH/GDSL hydrolase family protein [uncultured Maribacter sp.]|uniref:SGNH/GDSL hydrolase family protein n=1 Tax=uncultured Maribacter sp. TaxID=431308 RepID=UPI0030ED3D40|tara:strand:- start:1545 stop:2270 length:726 start_codon:yes stop_codon:yes gene_type:complete